MPIGIAAATLIAGAAGSGAALYGAHAAGKANKQATDAQAKATADQLAFAREQEASRKAEYDQQQAAAKAAWDAEQARKAPFRQTAQNAMVKLAQMTGLPAPSVDLTAPAGPPPPGWTPGGGAGPLPGRIQTASGGPAPSIGLSSLMPPDYQSIVSPMMNAVNKVAQPAESAAIPLTPPMTAQQMYTAGMMGGPGALPGRAGGGPVDEDRSYIVGENGPEVFTPEASGRITPNATTALAPNPGAPALGQPSMNATDVNQAYQTAFGRAPDARELASELENANKYGKSGILDQIARRTSNDPGTGDYGIADWSKIAGGASSTAGTPSPSPSPTPTGPLPTDPNRPRDVPMADPTLPLGMLIPNPTVAASNPVPTVEPGPYDADWWRRYNYGRV